MSNPPATNDKEFERWVANNFSFMGLVIYMENLLSTSVMVLLAIKLIILLTLKWCSKITNYS